MTIYTFFKTCYITFNTINFYIDIIDITFNAVYLNIYIVNSCCIVCNVSCISIYFHICCINTFAIIYDSLCINSDVLSIVCDVSSVVFYLTIDISDLSFNIVDNCRGLTYFAFQFINSFSVDIDILSVVFNSYLVITDKLTVFKGNCTSYINIFCILIYAFS